MAVHTQRSLKLTAHMVPPIVPPQAHRTVPPLVRHIVLQQMVVFRTPRSLPETLTPLEEEEEEVYIPLRNLLLLPTIIGHTHPRVVGRDDPTIPRQTIAV